MDLSLNETQLLVLRWVAAGADLDNPPSDTFKTSAIALRNRGLVDLDKRRGHWRIAITEAGAFYLEHGRHPKDESSKKKPLAPPEPAQKREPEDTTAEGTKTEPNPQPSESAGPKAKPARVVKDETIPMPEQVRRPHQAVREIVDHKARLDVPTEERQRALLILHALVQEALRRGWTVTAKPATFEQDPWNGCRTRVSPGPDLLSIDAGDAPATIRIRMQQRRVDHVPTEEELAKETRYNWRSYPKHDYVATERMRLEIRAGTHDVLALDDTVATRIEDKLLRAIERIQQLSVDARAAVERRRQWELERAEQQRRAEELRKRAARYTSWAETLEQLRSDFVRHRELTDAVTGLRGAVTDRGPEHEHAGILGEYLSWAEQHLEESDPLRRIWLPQGERPDLSHDEWQDWKHRNPQHW
ncbi:hypothetical protein [Kocuria palustris]|uniref:hypothetical protein n=1 Tax=Kocuria palustris TaxID=71999 RepID=UPI00195DD2AF|nr:hypothetical protein [Kocuria palustris]MBM7821767.1 FtsZ-binding cell division protein ZapB [Kocuria palustris]